MVLVWSCCITWEMVCGLTMSDQREALSDTDGYVSRDRRMEKARATKYITLIHRTGVRVASRLNNLVNRTI